MIDLVNLMFVLAWPLAIVCASLRWRIVPFACVVLLAYLAAMRRVTYWVMCQPDWNSSIGDALVPVVVWLPWLLCLGVIAARGLCVAVDHAEKRWPALFRST